MQASCFTENDIKKIKLYIHCYIECIKNGVNILCLMNLVKPLLIRRFRSCFEDFSFRFRIEQESLVAK